MTLQTYKILFTVFLILTIILFIFSIIIFFVFDIRKIFSIKTGSAVRKSVKELNEINRNEDNRGRKRYKSHSLQLHKELTGDFDQATEENINRTAYDSATEDAGIATVPLEMDGTVVLKNFKETALVSDVPVKTETVEKVDSTAKLNLPVEEEISEKEELFQIIDRKVVMFSQEIIPKEKLC